MRATRWWSRRSTRTPSSARYISPAGKVTERYTRWADGELYYQFKVEDPTLYKEAWGGEMALRSSNEPLYEYACHEGQLRAGRHSLRRAQA